MTTSRAPRVEIERVRANLAGLYATVAGVLIFNVAVFFEWATTDSDGFSGYEADSLWPYAAYLGLGFAAALLYAARRAYRRHHRGLTLASMAVGLATTLQCVAWLIDIPGAAEREVGDPPQACGSACSARSCGRSGPRCLPRSRRAIPSTTACTPTGDSANRGVPGAF